MLRVGRTLYVARNTLNQVATVRLDRSASDGTVVQTRPWCPTCDRAVAGDEVTADVWC